MSPLCGNLVKCVRSTSETLSIQPDKVHRHAGRARQRGLTLVEILIVIAILLTLFSVVVVSGKMTRDSTKRTTAQRQLAQLAAAIGQYASYWPAWKAGGATLADKGWPHFIPQMIFDPTYGYAPLTGFNDYSDLSAPPAPPATWLSSGATLNGAETNANDCLVYALTTTMGGGPFFRADSDIVQAALASNGNSMYYPALGAGGASVRQRFVDSWGQPLRYFWVYRDSNAFRGYLPVRRTDATDPNCPAGNTYCAKAVGFVLESAGLDSKYGNVWKTNPTAQEIADAEDNLIISP